jgi:predicted nucleotide-binding protein
MCAYRFHRQKRIEASERRLSLAPINPSLLNKIKNKLGVGQARAYAIIGETVRTRHVPRHIAALIVASQAGVGISNFATEEDFTLMRGTGSMASGLAALSASPSVTGFSPRGTRKQKAKSSQKVKAGNYVFVVHGRNDKVRKALFAFLNSVDVKPLEWSKALALTKKGSPYNGEVLDAAFSKAKAIVVLFTPDDEAKLKTEFIKTGDPSFERKLTGQPRPNVLFEAGMAFGRHPNSTVLVHVGKIRDISDVAGRQLVNLTNSVSSRHQLIVKLRAAGCTVDDTGEDWQTQGDFSLS